MLARNLGLLLALSALAIGCGSNDSPSAEQSDADGVLEPSRALELAKKSGAVPDQAGVYTSPKPERAIPPLVREQAWYVASDTRSEIARTASKGLRSRFD